MTHAGFGPLVRSADPDRHRPRLEFLSLKRQDVGAANSPAVPKPR
jgi:hypothetical protein